MKKIVQKVAFLALSISCIAAQTETPATYPAMRYAGHFTSGFTAQLLMNQAIGTQAHRWHLPELSASQTAVLTATGTTFATLPVMLTLTALVNLGLTTVADTAKGAAEAHAKMGLQADIDDKAIKENFKADSRNQDTEIKKALKARLNAYKLTKMGARAGARGTFLARSLAVGATLISLGGPALLERLNDGAHEQKEQSAPAQQATVDERILRLLERQEKESKNNPLSKMFSITPEQGFFFGGQLAAACIPNHFGIQVIKNIKQGNTYLQALKKAFSHGKNTNH